MNAATPLVVDITTDIVCPWCLVGNERLERVLAARGPGEPPVVVRHHPFLLQPDTPEEGDDVQERLRRKYGVEPRQAFARVEAAARESGLDLDLTKQARSYPTLRAHTLIRLAGPRGTQRAVARDLFRAHFLDARRVSDPDVLAEIGARHGFDTDEARALVQAPAELSITTREIQDTARLGISGVPFFVFGSRLAVSGAQAESVLRTALNRALLDAQPHTAEDIP